MKTRTFLSLIFLCMIVCLLPGCTKSNKKKYEEAKQLLMDEKLDEAEAAFSELKNYEDSNNYILYITALKKGNEGDYHAAASNLKSLGDFINSKVYSIYYSARELEESKDYAAAVELYDSISMVLDSSDRIAQIETMQNKSYLEAEALAEASKWSDAMAVYTSLGTYKDCEEKASQMEKELKYEEIEKKYSELMTNAVDDSFQDTLINYVGGDDYTEEETLNQAIEVLQEFQSKYSELDDIHNSAERAEFFGNWLTVMKVRKDVFFTYPDSKEAVQNGIECLLPISDFENVSEIIDELKGIIATPVDKRFTEEQILDSISDRFSNVDFSSGEYYSDYLRFDKQSLTIEKRNTTDSVDQVWCKVISSLSPLDMELYNIKESNELLTQYLYCEYSYYEISGWELNQVYEYQGCEYIFPEEIVHGIADAYLGYTYNYVNYEYDSITYSFSDDEAEYAMVYNASCDADFLKVNGNMEVVTTYNTKAFADYSTASVFDFTVYTRPDNVTFNWITDGTWTIFDKYEFGLFINGWDSELYQMNFHSSNCSIIGVTDEYIIFELETPVLNESNGGLVACSRHYIAVTPYGVRLLSCDDYDYSFSEWEICEWLNGYTSLSGIQERGNIEYSPN